MTQSVPELPQFPAKRCCLCRLELPVTAFSRNSKTKDGFQTQCKSCASKRWAVYAREGSCRPLRPLRPAQEGSKVCIKCQRELPLSNFYNGLAPEKRQYVSCKRCESEGVRERNEKNPDARRNRGIKRYGITVEAYNELAQLQGGVCAICGGEPNRGRARLDIDHNHETGVIRGLLCSSCNRVLGLVAEDPARLEAAVDYLKKTS